MNGGEKEGKMKGTEKRRKNEVLGGREEGIRKQGREREEETKGKNRRAR